MIYNISIKDEKEKVLDTLKQIKNEVDSDKEKFYLHLKFEEDEKFKSYQKRHNDYIEKLKQLKKYNLIKYFKHTIYENDLLKSKQDVEKLFILSLIVTFDESLSNKSVYISSNFNKSMDKIIHHIKVSKSMYDIINITNSLLMDYGRLDELIRRLQ
jgi:hypothetical protein